MKGGAPGNAGGGKKSKTAKLASFARNTPTTTRVSRRAVERDATRAKRLVVFGEIVGTPLQKMSDGTGEARSRARLHKKSDRRYKMSNPMFLDATKKAIKQRKQMRLSTAFMAKIFCFLGNHVKILSFF
jgi:hypothetical protein